MNLTTDKWTPKLYEEFIVFIRQNADLKYKEFHLRLIPDYSSDKIIGIRMPKLRSFAKEIAKGDARGFISLCGSDYYEEAMLRGIVTGLIKPDSFDDFRRLLEEQIPYINNWALCDCFCSSVKYIKDYRADVFNLIKEYLKSSNPWRVRVALVLMLNYYLDDQYISETLSLTDSVHSRHYYISMAQAWLVATAFSKNRDITLSWFEKCALDNLTFNRAVQKARESYRIDPKLKEHLKTLKKQLTNNTTGV